MLDFLKSLSLSLLTAFLVVGCAIAKHDTIPIIIDADTANEADDIYALVYALNEPKFDILGITSAQFHRSPLASDTSVLESQEINEDILRLMHKTAIPLPIGSNAPLIASAEPAVSEAADFIIKQAHNASEEKKLQLVILGSCTNVASAVLKDPKIIPLIQVNYLGFWHDTETNVYDKKEFNSGNDTLAVEVLLNTRDLDLTVMTATTSQHLIFKKTNIDKNLKNKEGIGSYLVDRWENYERWWTDKDPEKREWVMWDVALLMALAHPDWATKKKFITPPENTQRNIDIYTRIEVEKMNWAFWESISNFYDESEN